MPRKVSLPMYAVPEAALATFWHGLREHLVASGLDDVPDALVQPADLGAHWRDPELLLSQTCGFPLRFGLAGRVRYVATPHYRVDGCVGPHYSSAVVVRADTPGTELSDWRGRRVAFNSTDSQSGYNSLLALTAPLAEDGRFFSTSVETGAHRASLAAVRQGTADLAAIDVVTLALLRRDHPDEWAGLRVLTATASATGLPFIAASGTSTADVEKLRTALRAAFVDPRLEKSRNAMLLGHVSVLPDGSYDMITAMRDEAVARGYPALA